MADATGGEAFYGSNDIKAAMGRAFDDGRYAYTIGFYPNHGVWNGKFRKIKIHTTIDAAKLRYRAGYYASAEKADSDEARAKAAMRTAALSPLADPAVDIATLAAEIAAPAERDDPNVVKVVGTPVAPRRLRALYFTRTAAPAGEGPLYHHIGLYAYRRAALERFVKLPPSPLEQREKLEQLRALEAGMRIDVALIDAVPLGVDTPEDLEKARAMLSA